MKTVLFLDSRQDRQGQVLALLGPDYEVLVEASVESARANLQGSSAAVIIIGEYAGTSTLGFVYELRRAGFPGIFIGAIDDAKWISDFAVLLDCEVVHQLEQLPDVLRRRLMVES